MSLDRLSLGRLAVFTAIAVHLQLGGVFEQVLGRARPPTTMAWRMYASPGREVCEVSWSSADGAPIDRLATLGHPVAWEAPDAVKILHGEAGVRAAAATLCERLPGVDLRAKVRCGSRPRGAWVVPFGPEVALCDPAQARPAAPVRGKRGKRR